MICPTAQHLPAAQLLGAEHAQSFGAIIPVPPHAVVEHVDDIPVILLGMQQCSPVAQTLSPASPATDGQYVFPAGSGWNPVGHALSPPPPS